MPTLALDNMTLVSVVSSKGGEYMIETLYAQLISDPNTLKVLCRTDKRNITTETIYRADCKIIIRHKVDDFLSCLIVKR